MKRYAVYYAPPAGAFAERAAAWLGRDAETDAALPQPDLGLDAAALTAEARRYGFHGTLKAPFRLAEGESLETLRAALADLARDLAPVRTPGLRMAELEGFLVLEPEGDPAALRALAAEVVTRLDRLRAPLDASEIARRRPELLSPRQRALLELWGYPHVLEEFRFHLTLTGRLEPDLAARARGILSAHFAPVLPRPFEIGELCLFGEPAEGGFRLLHRQALSG